MKKRDIRKIVAVIEVLGIILLAYDFFVARAGVTSLDRPVAGTGTASEELIAKIDDAESDISAEISEKYDSASDRQAMLDAAKAEIDSSFCGGNDSIEHINQSVSIRESYVGGKVSAEWNFSDYSVITSEGALQYDNIEEPITVQASVSLKYQGQEEIYLFDFIVYPADAGNEEGRQYYLSRALSEADAADPEGDKIELPSDIGGASVHFKRPMEWRGFVVIVLGAVIFLLVPLLEEEKKKEEEKDRQRRLMLDYPRIVSQMSLYINAGVSVPNTINRMADEYDRRRKRGGKIQAGYEELKIWCNEVSAGKSEAQAFSNMGIRCNNADYKKLTMVLIQNMKKGSKGLAAKLEMEEQQAFEKRKDAAKTKGEEASTKLLMPMMGMLGIVLIILVYPAFMQMNL